MASRKYCNNEYYLPTRAALIGEAHLHFWGERPFWKEFRPEEFREPGTNRKWRRHPWPQLWPWFECARTWNNKQSQSWS